MQDSQPAPHGIQHNTQIVHVIGATGRTGLTLCRALGAAAVPVVRDMGKWDRTGLWRPARHADLNDAVALRAALADADTIVSCAHARHAGAILAAAPAKARFVFLGSTRKFTRWPDAHGNGVLAGEAAFRDSGRNGVMLHPTMIYGAQGEDNVQRLAALLRRLPVVPLPAGGTALVQPIHQDDVVAAILAAIRHPWDGPGSLAITGPAPITYADFIRAVARAAGLKPPRILRLPAAPLIALTPLTRLPGLPRIRAAEIRRLLEDKAFDVEPMRRTLNIQPMPLESGLARTFMAANAVSEPMASGSPT